MYDQQKKFGFAKCLGYENHDRKKVICHKMDIINADILKKNDLIDFTVAEGDRDRARNIFVVSQEI